MTAKIQLNGEPRVVAAGSTVVELLADLALPAQSVLVEHNGVALFRRDWPAARIADGDRVEVVRVVAGG